MEQDQGLAQRDQEMAGEKDKAVHPVKAPEGRLAEEKGTAEQKIFIYLFFISNPYFLSYIFNFKDRYAV